MRSEESGVYSDCLRRESNFLASTRWVTAFVRVCLLHCMRVRLRNGYTQAYAQIMQHMHTHKKKSYSPVEGNQTIVNCALVLSFLLVHIAFDKHIVSSEHS